jgi:EAL domain-containing protein (putative c-di-GMP-specific phosphodiesterase class I)
MLDDLLAGRRVRSLYQPLVHRASGDVIGYEALARGPAGHALERPDLLFSAARRADRLAELDWLCRAAAFDGALAAGLRPPTALFVNAEADVFDAPLPPEHAATLRRAAKHLKVLYEVTERGLSSRPAELLAEVERVRALGFGIAIDDLGTDWHSLALLPFIRPDVVKLDMALVQSPLTDQTRALAAAAAAYAAESGAVILAEGIETAEHEARADLLGAQLGQGWRYGRPAALAIGAAAPLRAGTPLVIDARPIELATPGTIALSAQANSIATKEALVRISIAIEARAVEQTEPSVVLGAFQLAEYFLERRTRERYRRLAEGEAFVGAFGVGMPAAPVPGVRGTALEANERLAGEWHIMVVGPHHAEALFGRDLGDSGPQLQRRFEYLHTTNRELIVRAARSLMLTIAPVVSGDRAHDGQRAA